MWSDLVKKFDAVSVREAAAIGLCKNYLGVDAVHLLDPTMLLSSKDYIELFKGVSKKQENLFCYVLDKSDEADQIIKELSGKGYLPYFSSSKLGWKSTVSLLISRNNSLAILLSLASV